MEIGKTLYLTDRKAWRKWLVKHHSNEPEIWLIYYNKASGKPSLPYNDAVEEALCFGWIDMSRKRPDEFKKRLHYFLKMTRQKKRFGLVQQLLATFSSPFGHKVPKVHTDQPQYRQDFQLRASRQELN